jgi:regulator of protease activity HflC (stomatin/prohibitin superfamily)
MAYFYGSLICIGILFLFGLFRSFFRVEEGHCALVTAYGVVKGKVYDSGLHFKLPWEKSHEFSVMERVLPVRENDREVEVLARDGTLLRLDPQIRLQFDPNHAVDFVFGLEKPISHIRELFRSLINNEIARFGTKDSEDGSYAEIRQNRQYLGSALARDLAKGLKDKYGISFRSLDIAEVLPPADLAQALNSVQKIEAEYETLQKRIQAECEQKVAAAEHGVEIAALHASAQEQEITILGKALESLHNDGALDEYVTRRQDEAASLSRTLFLRAE